MSTHTATTQTKTSDLVKDALITVTHSNLMSDGTEVVWSTHTFGSMADAERWVGLIKGDLMPDATMAITTLTILS